MTVTILFPLLILVIGLLVYLLAEKPKVVEVGRIMFFCGMLVVTWMLATKLIKF